MNSVGRRPHRSGLLLHWEEARELRRFDAHGQFRHKDPLTGLILHLDHDLVPVAIREDVPGDLAQGSGGLLPSSLNPVQLHARVIGRGACAIVDVEEVAWHGGNERRAVGDGSGAYPRATSRVREHPENNHAISDKPPLWNWTPKLLNLGLGRTDHSFTKLCD